MWYDRPSVECYVVLAESPEGQSQWTDGRKVYGNADTKEGAEMLKEEAIRTGWKRVTVETRRKSLY